MPGMTPTDTAVPTLSWDDILEVGQGGPGCGLLSIDGRQPKGHFRYLPPALVHDGKVYASTFVPGGFVLCAIDPVTLVREEVSPRLPYARIEAIEGDAIVYVDRHDGSSVARHPLARPQSVRRRLTALFGKG